MTGRDSEGQGRMCRAAVGEKTGAAVSHMALKFKAKSKEEIPAELQSLYVERDGAFVLFEIPAQHCE